MAEPVRFTPQELDRIEDALEGLEDFEVFDDPSPEVRDVLAQYRQVLVDTRQGMPLEEVPAGVLDAVFAEAHAAVAQPQASVVAATPASQSADEAEEKPGFWRRLRRSFLIPSVALAGTAALVLWISRPGDNPEGMDQPEVAAAKADGAAFEREKEKPTAAKDAVDNESLPPPAAAAPEPEADAPAAAEIPAPAQQEAVPDLSLSGADQSNVGELNKLLDEKPGVEEKPADSKQERGEDSVGWASIERADRAREDGDCAAARSDYMIATEDDDAKVRARAYAGLGLCSAQQGDDVGAEDSYERARGIDPGVDSFISAEKRSSGTYSPTSKPKRKKKAPRKSTSKSKTKGFPKAGPPSQKNAAPKSKKQSKMPSRQSDIDNAMTDPF